MVHIFGIKLNDNKKVTYALTEIFGIGNTSSIYLCDKLGISRNYPVYRLSELQISKLSKLIEQNFIIEGDLHYIIKNNINRLVSINSYRGYRHTNHLPVRGQRTHTNAKTVRKLNGKKNKI